MKDGKAEVRDVKVGPDWMRVITAGREDRDLFIAVIQRLAPMTVFEIVSDTEVICRHGPFGGSSD